MIHSYLFQLPHDGRHCYIYCYSTHCTNTKICNYYCSDIFYLYRPYTALSIYLYFFFNVCFLHSIFQSLDAYFGFKQ